MRYHGYINLLCITNYYTCFNLVKWDKIQLVKWDTIQLVKWDTIQLVKWGAKNANIY